ncbi:hypothetical protein [Acidovorax cavernicola]|uniref:Lipoprotein n=1 Tax=Acidovorax cavernicola TaxID=1675792 RepID=A0A9X8D0Y3_9BURK|nr:hypothetical protein [Acidovorax cavernicola]RIX75526.1 hypothetical protein D3H34_25130 [Acidovorax cavernicola]
MPSLPSPSWPVLALAAVLGACSPTFNWREVPIADAGLVALLPCKADRAQRALPLGAESVQVDMTGCEAGGATFAVAHAVATSPAQAEAWLTAWRTATRGQLGVAQVIEGPATLPRATAVPAPIRLDGLSAQKGVAPVQVLWFAQSQKDGSMSLYQATVLGRPSSPEAAKTFFEGLRLP